MEHTWLTLADRAVLEGFFLFQDLSPALIEKTLADQRCWGAVYSCGQVIFDPDRFDACLGLILSGKVEASPKTGGLILRFHRQGDVFGAAAVFSKGEPYVARLTALTQTRVLFFRQDLLRALMEQEFTAAENYMAFLVGRVQFLNHRIQSLTLGSAERLVLDFLEKEAEDTGFVNLDFSLSALARRLNISRASLYRAFDALEERGLIEKTGKAIQMSNKSEDFYDD